MKFWHNIHKLLFKDWIAKIISIGIATFLWYYVHVLSIETTYITLPISIINQPQNYLISPPKNLFVRATFAARDDISQILPQLEAVIDLEGVEASSKAQKFPIIINNLPNGIKYELSPKHIPITISSIITNRVPVVLNTTNEKNLFIKNIEFSPKTISLIGPPHILKQIDSIKTRIIDLATFSIDASISRSLIIPKDTMLLESNIINIMVTTQQYNVTNNVILPISLNNLSADFVIAQIPNVEATIVTMNTNIEELLLKTDISVDLSSVKGFGVQSFPLNISKPQELNFIKVESNVTLLIENSGDIDDINFAPVPNLLNKE